MTRPGVLVLIKGLGIGGAERLIAEAAPVWDRSSFDYRVAYALPHKDAFVPAIEAEGVPVACIGGPSGLDTATPRRFRHLLARWRPAVVHAHSPTMGILARVATTTPCVYTEHNVADSYRRPTRIANRLTYGRNAAVTAVSEAVADSLVGFPGPTPVVVPNGVSPAVTPESVDAVRAELDHAGPLVVHVGNIRPLKGHANLIAATQRLVRTVPDVLVVSVGTEKMPGDLARVRADADQAGVGDTIRFLGLRPDARAFLAAADVVVNPSDAEGLPLVVLEALALGRPVVATAVGGVPSIVEDRCTGLLVPAGDPDSLAAAVAEALATPEAVAWGRAGSELVLARHGIEPMVRAFERIYAGVVDA